MSENQTATWKRCGVCKRDIGFDEDFYECSVSTCTSSRSHPVFCSVTCWEEHVPVMRHRDAWAEQKRSPSKDRQDAASAAEGAGAPRRIVVDPGVVPRAVPGSDLPMDVLLVASKLKAYIRARSGMNTSESVLEELSNIVRRHADRAIEQARADGRKTVMDRDFRPVLSDLE